MANSIKSVYEIIDNTPDNTHQKVYQGDPSRIKGGRKASTCKSIAKFFNPINCFFHRIGGHRYNDYQKLSNNLVKSLNDFPDIKSVAVKILYLTNGEQPFDTDKISAELNSMKPVIYHWLGFNADCSASPASDPNKHNKTEQEITTQEIRLSAQELAEKLDSNTAVLSGFDKFLRIIKSKQTVSSYDSNNRVVIREIKDIDTAIHELTLACLASAATNRSNFESQLATKEKMIVDKILHKRTGFRAIGNLIHEGMKKADVPNQYRQISGLNISWNVLLHIFGQDTEFLRFRFTDLEIIREQVFHSLDSSAIREGKDGGISWFFTRFMNPEDKDINNSNRAKRVKEFMTLEKSISSGKLRPIPLDDGVKTADSVEKVEISFSSGATLQSNEVYNFKKAILYAAYGCHIARLEGDNKEYKACLDIFTMTSIAYFFYMMRAELSEGFSHADVAIQIIEFIVSIGSDRLSWSSKQEGFREINQLNRLFSEFYHKYCAVPQPQII